MNLIPSDTACQSTTRSCFEFLPVVKFLFSWMQRDIRMENTAERVFERKTSRMMHVEAFSKIHELPAIFMTYDFIFLKKQKM